LKPANIVANKSGSWDVKVVDLGMATILDAN